MFFFCGEGKGEKKSKKLDFKERLSEIGRAPKYRTKGCSHY